MLNISRIFLNKDKRNQGYGRKIINLIKKEASKRNLKKLRICIPVDKEETSLIFTKLGFKKSHETAWYLGDDVFLYSYIYISDL